LRRIADNNGMITKTTTQNEQAETMEETAVREVSDLAEAQAHGLFLRVAQEQAAATVTQHYFTRRI
jgi:hypothetical protein